MKKENRLYHYHRGFGDRYDGWRVRNIDPVFRMIPYFLRNRTDSQNLFEQRVDIGNIEEFIKQNKAEIPDLSLMHIIMASIVRLISQRPKINRFIIWNKIFARNYINFSLAIKRSISDAGEETLIKIHFSPYDTLQDIVKKVQAELNASQHAGQENSADKTSKILGFLPDFMLRFVVFVLIWLDRVGLMPKALAKVSPWHCSIFLTNIGSIGVESIYHHLYEFGTCSMFIAMGKKSKKTFSDKQGNQKTVHSIKLKFVMDERICDGYYYASSMRMLNKILANPNVLLTPPASVITDDGVRKKIWIV